MNADRLLELYDKVSEAPDAIERLRRFVLDLAVRGKVVAQDANDEPASGLLKRIAAEVGQSTHPRKGRSDNETVEGSLEVVLPSSWALASLGAISSRLHYGYTASASKTDKDVRLLRITDIQDNHVEWDNVPGCEIDTKTFQKYALEPGDLLIARTGGTIGKTFLVSDVPVKSVFASYLIRVQPARGLHSPYLKLFCGSNFYWEQLRKGSRGGGQPNVNGKTLGRMAVPIPPQEEQRRIVAKVEELMALLDRLEAARSVRETTRDRLTTASLTRLTAPDTDPESFPDHARFALEALAVLTARPDQIKSVRQTILNLAVRGKLVEQDMSDEPASDLLKRIAEEKRRLIREGKFKTFEGNLDRSPNSFTFSIPSNWSWCYLDDVAAVARGGSPRPIKSFITDDPDGIPWIKIGDSNRGSIYIDETRERIKPEGLKKSRLVIPGDLLLSNSMSFGFPYITNVEGCIHDGWLVIRTPDGLIDKLYLHKVFLSDYATAAFSKAASGAVVQNLNADKARQLAFPLPPIAEQRRIVAQVDELTALLDRLEPALAQADTTRAHLLEALIYESLEASSSGRETA